jgi:hypothetical protein
MTSILSGGPTSERHDALTALWHFFTSSRWAALLLALLALTAVAAAAWPRFGPATGPAVFSGSVSPDFASYRALWLRLLLAAFAFSLVLRLADRFEVARHLPQHLSRARALYAAAPPCNGQLAQPVEQLTDTALRALVNAFPGGRSFRIWQATEGDCEVIYVERLRFAVWGDVALHLGCLVIIAGLFVAGQWDWHETAIALAAGEGRPIAHAPGYGLALESTRLAAGRHESRVTVTLPGGGTRQGVLAPAQPWLVWPFALFQTSSGPAVRLSAVDAAGQPLLLQTLAQRGRPSAESVVLKFAGEQDDASVSVPALDITLRVDRYASLPEEGYWMPVCLIQAFQGSRPSPLFSRYFWQDDSYTWQGNTYKMTLEDYAIFSASSNPGWAIAAAGALLLVCGAALRQRPVPLLARIATSKTESLSAVEVTSRSAGAAAEDFLRQLAHLGDNAP